MKSEKIILKVASGSNVSSLAGSIVKSVESNKEVELNAIGASAVNQAVKAFTIARGLLASKSIDVLCKTGFKVVDIDGKEVTSIVLKLIVM